MTLNIGDKAPLIELPDDKGQTVNLADFKGQPVVVYFYPKDDTPGCTSEACGFRDNLAALNQVNAAVFGISKDSVKSHAKFRDKYELTFPLLSDETGAVCDAYGVWTEKSMYGRKYMGIERATFLIDKEGKIAKIWPKVSVTGHVAEVVKAVQALG